MASHRLCALAVRVDGGQTTLHGTLGKDHHMMRIALRTALPLLTFIAAFSAPANALETIFGNPNLFHNGMELPGGAGTPEAPYYDWLGQGFTMGTQSYDLAGVEIGLRFINNDFASIQVALYGNSGGSPDTAASPVATFTNPTFNNGPDVFTFTTNGTVTLASNTTYWLVVKYDYDVGTSLFTWMYSQENPTSGNPVAPTAQNGSGITYAGTKGYDVFNPGWFNFPSSQAGLRYAVLTVPEPSTYALGAIGTLVMAAVARRRSRKTASA